VHEAVLNWIGQFRSQDDLAVLDIGGRDLNGSPRMFFPNANPYHVLDLHPGPNVDIVTDAASWQPVFSDGVSDAGYDLVICTEVFEHTPAWPAILATAWRSLRPGGWLLFTCAGPGRPVHSGITAVWALEPGEHYANVSHGEIAAELHEQGWTEIETHQNGLDSQGNAVKPSAPREHLFGATLSRTAAGNPNA
jgi:SAM-dependent methyltransferase